MAENLTKATIILKSENSEQYSLQALYGQISKGHPLFVNELVQIISLTSEILNIQNFGQKYKYIEVANSTIKIPLSKFNQSQDILTLDLLSKISLLYTQLKNKYSSDFSATLLLDQKNQLQIDSVLAATPKLTNYYLHGPKVFIKKSTSPHQKSKALSSAIKNSLLSRKLSSKTLKTENQSVLKNKISRMQFIEHHNDISDQRAISFVDAKQLFRTLLTHVDKNDSFESSLLSYIVLQKKINPQSTILYQSLSTSGTSGNRDISFFEKELHVLYQLLHTYKYKQIILSLPLVRSHQEIVQIKNIIRKAGLTRSSRFKIFLSIQLPSNILLLDNFIDQDIDGLLFDIPIFVRTMYGIDTENTKFDTDKFINNPGTQIILNKISKIARDRRIPLYVRDNQQIVKVESPDSRISTQQSTSQNLYIAQ
jgi:hypothetical protein